MTDDLRTLLHSLADALSSTSVARPASVSTAETLPVVHTQMIAALRAFADGDVSAGTVRALAGTTEGEHFGSGLARVRDLVSAARGAVAAGTDKMDEVRAACERAADGVSRQRVGLDRTVEQVKQVSQRIAELGTMAEEIGEWSDRASLLALNTGIEGLRVGGEVARTLGTLGDELRKLAQRTSGGARELVGGLRTVSDQARSALGALEDVRASARQSSDETTRAATVAESARRAETSLASALTGFRALDEETEVTLSRLESAAEKLAREIAEARARLGRVDGAARAALEAALARVTGPASGT